MGFELLYKEGKYTEEYFKNNTNLEDSFLEIIQEWYNPEKKIKIKTSGSTGAPKNINLSREKIITSSDRTLEALNMKKGDSCLLCINHDLIGGRMVIYRSMIGSLKLYTQTEISRFPFKKEDYSHIDYASVVPLQLENFNEAFLPKKILIGGAPLSMKLEEKLSEITNSEIYASYGMTETYSNIALRKINGKDKSFWFKPYSGIDIGQSTDNTLTISDSSLGITELKTTDIVEINKAKFKVLGRKDNIINSGGIKIIPEIVERKLGKIFTASQDYFVGGLPSDEYGSEVCLFVLKSEDIDIQKIQDSLSVYLTKYEIPKKILTLDTFEYTGSNKVHRTKTITRYLKKHYS